VAVARDVSQRVEPNVRPLGRAVSTLIAERTRRLPTLLTSDVPPQHLLWPVHLAGRRRPSHPAGGVPVQSIAKQYARAARCTMSIITYALPGKLPLHANTMQIVDVRVQEDCSSNSKYYIHYIPGPTCRGPVPLYAPPLSYKRGGMQRYIGTWTLRPNLDLDLAQAHKFIQALKLNTSHSGVGYYAPAA
jgi:hypothetical protein